VSGFSRTSGFSRAVVVLAWLSIIIVLASWLIRGIGRRFRRVP